MRTVIVCHDDHPAIQFAAAELARYLRLATGKAVPVIPERDLRPGDVTLRLKLEAGAGGRSASALRHADDSVRIGADGRGYVLAGSNPRSVLFAAYRYLRALGFRWIRPGARGEIIPRLKSPVRPGIRVKEAPSYRYRTICIEGACSEEHVTDLIDWMTKQGMNGYFIQFNYGTQFWSNWYRHPDTAHMRPELFDADRAQALAARTVAELRTRDLCFERMGHGWTCIPLGIPGEGWGRHEQDLPAERKAYLAMLNGRRDLFHGVPLNTNLCYSNPAVRNLMTDEIVGYAAEHPEVTALHLWLADGSNNNCECPDCAKARPSDFYVQLLNELDAKLASRGLPTRIVFLVYVDLFWPPERERLRNPGRFILMFAPITRSYLQSFADAQKSRPALADYARNKLAFPKGAAENLAYLRAWQKQFPGDGFDFDYHLLWASYYDLAHFTLARTLHRDIQSLEAVGLHGFNSCQVQRQSFPTNLLMDVMARTLWNRRAPFSRIVAETFVDAYGRDGARVAQLLEHISGLWKPFFEPVYTPAVDRRRIAAGRRNLPRLRADAGALRKLVDRNARHPVPAVRLSWKYLASYAALLDLWLPAVESYLAAAPDTRSRYERVIEFARRHEPALHPALDVATFAGVLRWRINELEEHLKKAAAPAPA